MSNIHEFQKRMKDQIQNHINAEKTKYAKKAANLIPKIFKKMEKATKRGKNTVHVYHTVLSKKPDQVARALQANADFRSLFKACARIGDIFGNHIEVTLR